MKSRSLFLRQLSGTAAALLSALALISCGASGSTYTAPSTLSKCAVAFDAPAGAVPADGGRGVIPVKTDRECAWTAEPDTPWLSITAGRSGQGNGTVEFSAAPNGDPVARSGGIMLNGTRAAVTQAASTCRFTLAESSTSIPQSGGSGSVEIRASSALCTWTAESDTGWISITSGASGKGSAMVSFTVAPTTGPPRTGGLTIAGLHFSITQSEGCAYAIAPSTYAAGAAGGSNTVSVTTAPGCPWTAASEVSWISLATSSGTGSGAVSFTVAATTGPPRTGTATIAGQVFTVTQSPGCAFDVSPLTHNVDAGGGTRTVGVNTAGGCTWTATSNAPWITITGGASGSGGGTVTFAVAATAGPARTATLTVGQQTVTVLQGQGCTYAVSPDTQAIPSSGGSGSVGVTAGAGCAWTASSGVPWITITSGAGGSGSGTVAFTAAPTTGPSRSGTIDVAGRSVTVVQGQGCTFAIAPDSRLVPAGGADGSVSITAGAGCPWAASSNAPWITITSGGTGSGDGSVGYRVAATTGAARSGSLTIAGRTFTINQGADCTTSLSSSSATAAAGGGDGTFDVRTADGCGWTASSTAPWLAVTAGASGNGNGTVRYQAAANTGPQRTGTIVAGGQTFTVVQDGGCTIAISPAGQNVPSGGASGSFAVNAGGGCTWTATANATWIAITSGASGTGGGTIQFTAAANSGASRSGTITIGGQTFTVTQDTGCTVVVAPDTIGAPAAGGSQNVGVTTAADCSWTAASNASWIGIPGPGSRSGNATVQLDIQANDGPARSGTATIAGKTVSVNQDSGCTVSIAPAGQVVPVGGGTGAVNVTTRAGCTWTAVSNAAWITVTKGASGSGDGAVEFSAAANATGAARSGTITIGGRVFTVDQPAM